MDNRKKIAEHYFTEQPKSKVHLGLIRTYLRERSFQLLTASGVFSKERIDLGTRLLVENMVLPEKGCVLDVGCGYGAVGIAAAIFNPDLHVVMVDVNMRAIRLARQNAELNHVWNVEIRHGHLYEPTKDLTFDCILSNPPVSAGMKTVEAIITEAPTHLTGEGTLQMVVKSKIGGKRLQAIFEKAFSNVDVLARGSGYRVLISKKQ
jgi:16S rRNA (guanine1207-N2)-methyltransferase